MRKLVAVLALATVALAGCGSSTSTGGTGAGSGGGSEFSKLLAKTNAATYKVTYRRGDDTPFTIAQKPPRFSYTSGDSSTYVTADGSAISCSGKGPTATCTAMAGGGDAVKQGLTSLFGALGALFVSEANQNIPGLESLKSNDKSIAGRDAACAKLDGGILGVLGAAIKASALVCVDKETGVLLESTADDGGGSTASIKATAFGEPTDADLTPPATPITLPDVPTS
jgi:hypothetical protein